MHRSSLFMGLSALTLLSGCEISKPEPPQQRVAWEKGSAAAEQVLTQAGVEPEAGGGARKRMKPVAVPLSDAKITPSRRIELPVAGGQGFMTSSSLGSSGSFAGPSEAQAIQQIRQSLERSLEVGPTLVVWVVDQSASAAKLTTSALVSIRGLYQQEPLATFSEEGRLLTAVVGFADATTPLLDPPVGTPAAIGEALQQVKNVGEGRELLFTAVDETLTKYLPFRTQQGREMLIVVLTDEPGDDLTRLDGVIKQARKAAVPIYVLGETAALGKAFQPSANFGANNNKDPNRTLATDVLRSDLAPIRFWSAGMSEEPIDSGFGPWGLERMCRETEGRFFAVGAGSFGNFNSRFDPAIMAKYAPDYVAPAEFDRHVAENRCRAALLKVAEMEPAESMPRPRTTFQKGNNEARFAQALTQAQRDPARIEPTVNRIFEPLLEAEGDRAKLTGLRWQAAYDTAYGRICAAKARVDGYNAMIAMLKRGKTFTNPSSTGWVLETGDKIETGSAIQKISDKAKLYLERVVKEHPGTPWAKMAEEELRTPLGWTWREA